MAIPAKKSFFFFFIRGISHRGTYVGWGTSNDPPWKYIGTPPEIPHGTPGNGWVRPSSVHLLTFPREFPIFRWNHVWALGGVKKIYLWILLGLGNMTKSNHLLTPKQVPSQMTGGQLETDWLATLKLGVDLTRPHPKCWWFSKGNGTPKISGKPRLVEILHIIWPRFSILLCNPPGNFNALISQNDVVFS